MLMMMMRAIFCWALGVRRRKVSLDKSQDEGADDQVKQHEAQATPASSEPAVPAPKPAKTSAEKPSISLRKPAVFAQNGTPPTPGTDTAGKRKRTRKTDSEIPNADQKTNSSSKPSVWTDSLLEQTWSVTKFFVSLDPDQCEQVIDQD